MEPRAGPREMWTGKARSELRIGQASQALGRKRKAAKQSKTAKFTTLLHHVDVRLLRESYLS